MYPTLMVAGGIITLAWDNRHRLIAPLTSRLPSKRSPSAHDNVAHAHREVQIQEDPEAIELNDRPPGSPSQSSDKSADGAHVSVSTGIMPEVARNAANSPSSQLPGPASGLRQRPIAPINSSAEHEQPDTGEVTPLMTMGMKPALALAIAFIALVITFVVMKSTLSSLGRPFDVS
jgi:hypothetical protein